MPHAESANGNHKPSIRERVSVWGYDPRYDRVETTDAEGTMTGPIYFRRRAHEPRPPKRTRRRNARALDRFWKLHVTALAIDLLLAVTLGATLAFGG